MPIVSKEYTRNLDVTYARRLDDALTYFNLHSMSENPEYSEELKQTVLLCRDAIRIYWMAVESEWEGVEEPDYDTIISDLANAFTTLGQIWSELRW